MFNFIRRYNLWLMTVSLASLIFLLLVRLFPASLYKVFPFNHYLLFHGLAELFSIIISLLVFILSWATFKQTESSRSLFIGVSFLGVAILDTFHLFSFPGMPGLFTEASTHKAIYFWLWARLWVVSALLAASFLPTRNTYRLWSRFLLLGITLAIVTLVVVTDVFFGSYVPPFYIAGEGLTPLKIALEWVVMALGLVAFLFYGREYFKRPERPLLFLMTGLIFTLVSEMCFTFYASAFDTYNLLGHIYKFTAYGFFFYALFIAEIQQPYDALQKAYKSLAESEAAQRRFSSVLETTSDFVAMSDKNARIFFVNQAGRKMLGIGEDEDITKTALLYYYPQWAGELVVCQGLPEAISKGVWSGETAFLSRDGREIPTSQVIIAHKNPQGELEFFSTIARDITERKQAEAQLRKLFRGVEQAPSIMVITDDKGDIEYVNPKFTEITGYTLEEVRGQNPRILKSGHTPPEEYKRLWDTITGGGEWRGEFRNKKKNGELYWESASISPIKDDKGIITHFVKVAEDTTEHRHLEEQLLQSQKIEAIGTLAGGVAHDFNNLLTAIIGNLELAKFKSKDRAVESNLDEIENIVNRAALLTRQLLAFSRRQILQPVPLNLNDTITNMNQMLSRLLGEHIEMVLHLEGDLGMVKADAGQIEQVIMNLCVNARDAMPTGGELILETKNISLDERYIEGYPWVKSGDYVMFAVTDTGMGMDEAIRQRIFEPFFTTKEIGKGTGLGLSMIYGIVKQHQGYINVYSEPGHGTTFKIYLPRSEEKAAAAAEVIGETPRVEEGKETILLAEDEDSLRKTIQQILEMYGYKVLAAKDGQEAVEIYEREKENIDLAILDAVMPKMGGRQVAEWIYRQNPEQKILFSSGYSANGIQEAFIIPGEVHFIQKPYTAQTLAQKVREVLEA